MLHPIALYEVNRSCTTSWQFAVLWFPNKSLQILLNDNQAFLPVSFRSSTNCLSCISSLISGPINIPSLIFASLTFGTLCLTYWNPQPVLSTFFIKFFMRISFMCRGGRQIFSARTRGGLTTFFSPGVSDVRLGHSLFTQWFCLSQLSHSHSKQQHFVYRVAFLVTELQPSDHQITSTSIRNT